MSESSCMEPTPPASPHSSIATHFSSLRDPRVVGRSAHELLDILTIAILAVICGSKGWEDIEDWATDHVAWLRTFLRLRNGIPQHDCTYQAAGLPGCGLPRSSAERGSPRRRASAAARSTEPSKHRLSCHISSGACLALPCAGAHGAHPRDVTSTRRSRASLRTSA